MASARNPRLDPGPPTEPAATTPAEPSGVAPVLRLARPDDGSALAAIYAPYVRDTVISLELDPPSDEDMAARIERTLPRWPWLVAEVAGTPVGYAYGGAHRPRPGYRWSVEVSAYVDTAAHGRGVGRRLYTTMLDLLAHQGHHLALAGIGLPNPASVGFHEALGFDHVGTFREIGHKFGTWHDVGWWQRSLAPGSPSASPGGGPRSLDDLDPQVLARLLD